MNVILQQVQTMQKDDLDSLFNQTYQESPVSFDVNPLVLSVRLKKMSIAEPAMWRQLQDPEVKAQLTGEDFNEAEAIKNYYSKKMLWAMLKDGKLSSFRSDLLQLLEHPKSILSKKEIGMFVRLPYFYQEDQILDSIARQYRVINCPDARPNLQKITRELVYIHSTSRWMNKKKQTFYWFGDDNRFVYNIQIEESNPLRKFFEDIVLAKSTNIFETYITKIRFPFDYYKMFDYKLVKL